MIYSKILLQSLGMTLGCNLLLSFLPAAPLFAACGGGIGAYWLQRQILLRENVFHSLDLQRNGRIYHWSSAVCCAALMAFVHLSLVLGFLRSPLSYDNDWFQVDWWTKLITSPDFAWGYFALSLFVAFASHCLGSMLSFRLQVAKPSAREQDLFRALSLEELNEYL